MVSEIMQADSFYDFLSDQYGNYVIQKALQVADEPVRRQFLEKLKPDVALLQQSQGFGQKIFIRLVKQYPELNPSETNFSTPKPDGWPESHHKVKNM